MPKSSSKLQKESKSLESKVSSQQSTEEMGSEDSDRCESQVVNSTEAEEKHWYELLKEKIGFDINAKKWMEEHPELAYKNKSELLIRLACEVCLAKNTKYDPENENEEQNNKYIRFDSQRIFALFEVANPLIEQSDRKNFVEFVCQKGNVQLLEMICKKESLKRTCHIEGQYKWQGSFTGYAKLIDLLQYVIDNQCPPEIVLCIVEKIYGYTHIFYNGEQYLEPHAVANVKKQFNYQISVVKELLKQAIKLGYKDVVSVMLAGDIYHCIRLMKWKVFKEKPEFIAARDMIKETVADVISSWVEGCKDDIRRLLDQEIEIELHEMSREDLTFQLECLGEKLIDKTNCTKGALIKKLKDLGKEKGEVRLRSIVVGALISTLFFNYQDKVMKGGLFTLKIKQHKSKREKMLNELNKKISNGESIENIVLELIKSLNLGSHIRSNWFFREVLAKVVNENLDKLKAVCAAICKEPMEELLKGEEIHEDVRGVLQFFGVEVLTNQTVRTEIPSSCSSIADQFMKDINVYSEKEAKEDCSSDELAFSGLTRKIIRELEEKQDLTDKEKRDLIFKAVGRIKEGINILADKTAVKIDVKDIFISFELINSKIEKEQKREIVELVCQKGNVKLLEMICKQEGKNSKEGAKVERQYKWQGTFTDYSKFIDLLQYVIDSRCSPKIVLCIVEKIYGYAHIFYNGEQYLEPHAVANVKRQFNYQISVVKELLKQAIKLGYKDVVSVMLVGDIYHCIRLMKWKVFKEKPEFIAARDMIKETVADVISSWVEGCKDDIRRLLDQEIEIELHEMSREDLTFQLECLGEKLIDKTNCTKGALIKKLKDLGKEKGEVRLRSIVVGALISTLFFNYQDKVMKGGLFTLKIKQQGKSEREKMLNELNKKISNGESIENIVLELIKLLNLGSHVRSNWFFREVLAKVVNENLDKLKAVCAAICKEPMEELLKGEEIHEDVTDVLQFFGVDTPSLKRDLGSVESQEIFEYTDSSSTTETNKLSSQNIVDIAKYYYKWMEPINGKYLEGMNEKVFFTCTDIPSLEDKLKHYKKIQQKDLIFTSIINTGREHWVTLIVARNVQGKDAAYYCDSFGKKEIPSVLKKALKIDTNYIGISQIKQHEDEYNCGIFALANAYKITGIIKDKSITEINVELKGKFDANKLREEFEKKVKEMRQKSGVDSEEEVHDLMEVEDGVDALSSRQLSAETSHDLPEVSIAGPSRVKVLPSVSPSLKAAERKNEEFVKNDCRQNKSIHYSRGVVSVIAPRISVFHERKVMIGGSSKRKRDYSGVEDDEPRSKHKRDWFGEEKKASKQKPKKKDGIKFIRPSYLQFLEVKDEYISHSLEHQFSYDKLKLLCTPSSNVGYDSFSSPSSDEFASPTKDEESEETAFEMYDRAITLLMNGKKEEAIVKLNCLSVEEKMPHARYALAIIKFKDLWEGKATRFEKDKESDSEVFTIIRWLNDVDLEKNLRPLNWSLLLKVKKYDIGGYGEKINDITGLTTDYLFDKVLSCTKDTNFNFDDELVSVDSLLKLGQLISSDVERQNHAESLVRFAMYEYLKSMILASPNLRTGGFAALNALSTISECKFTKKLDYFSACVMYLHATYLLMNDVDGDDGKKNAVGLLNKACKLKHKGALYLRGSLLCDRKNFKFISEDSSKFQEYLNGLEAFAKEYKSETAACMAANEYVRNDCLVQLTDRAKSEEKAEEILKESGCTYIWKDLKDEQQLNSRQLSSTPMRAVSLRRSRFSASLMASQAHSSSSSVSSTSFQGVRHSPVSPMSCINSSFTQGLSLGSRERSESVSRKCSVSRSGQSANEDITDRRNISHKFISTFDDQRLNGRSISSPRKEYFFLTRKSGDVVDKNFFNMEEYCKRGQYNKIVSDCESLISLEGSAGHVTDEVIFKAYYNKGEALFVQDKYKEAIQVLEKVFDLNRLRKKDYQQVSVARLIAEIYCKTGQYNKAISILKEVSNNSDESFNTLINKDIKEIESIQSSRNTTGNIFASTEPSTSMNYVEQPEEHMDTSYARI